MNPRLGELWTNLAALVRALPPARRAWVLAAGVGSLCLVLGLAWWAERPLYRPLFTNLDQPDAAAIVAALERDQVPHRLTADGRAVLVPADRLYRLRLSLASRGLPEGGGVGFEIFDRHQLGQTDFVQRLNYQRALQGELERTIAELDGVERARVHVAMPEQSGSGSPDRRPTASVVVKLMAGRTLTPAQLDGIVHLVAASVQGLVPEDVTVIDESGRMLTATRRGGDGLVAQGAAAAYQQAVERAAEERIESLLATVVGAGKVVARVAATVDFARTERTEEIYDPDRTVVRESHAMSEETAGGPDAKAPMGTRPDAAAPRTERRDETQSFEVSKTTSRTIAPMGGVKALSVAVLIDGTYREQDGTRVFVPRTEDELARFRSIVASAVGISEERGDRLEVTSAPFQPPAAAVADPSPLATAPAWPPAMVLRLLGLGAIGLVLVLVVRPLVRALGRAGAPAQRGAGAVVAERESTFTELARQNATLAQRHPERAAELVRRWLVETKVA